MTHVLPAAPMPEPRPIGLGKGLAEIPDAFFDPLPDDLLDLFEGKRTEPVPSPSCGDWPEARRSPP